VGREKIEEENREGEYIVDAAGVIHKKAAEGGGVE